MRPIFYSVLVMAGLLLTGCRSVCDGRGPSEICEVHHQIMQQEIIERDKHFDPTPAYAAARAEFFPHGYHYFLPKACPKCMVYICEDCARAEQEWRRRHPGESQNN